MAGGSLHDLDTDDSPFASISTYGPDNARATKLVATVFESPNILTPPRIRTWRVESGDIRTDPEVTAAVAAFLAAHGVEYTMRSDRILGCPHEQGVDYPMGRACPRCPFWDGIDPITHEPVATPSPSMSVADVLRTLADDEAEGYVDALASADGHRDALVGPLLDVLDRCIADPHGVSEQDLSLFAQALYLLARWRETRAYPYVVRWLSLPEAGPFILAGDIVTQDGPRILAGVCDQNWEPIKALVLRRASDGYCRSVGVTALALLAAWGEVPRQPVIEWYRWLADEGLEREPNPVWSHLAAHAADIEALEVFPALRRAYDEGLIDSEFVSPSELDEVEAMSPGVRIAHFRISQPPIRDVAAATGWWNDRWRDDEDDDPAEDMDWGAEAEVIEPYRAPPKVGRNEPCPCGSGKKYKKCCGR